MPSGKFNLRICTNSFSRKEQEMTRPLKPANYFGFKNKTQYSYNLYHQLANNGPSAGSRGARWARINNILISFNQN